MGRINYGRVVIGGLLAGVVINVAEFILNGLLLRDAYEATMGSYGLTEATWAMIGYIAAAFAIGLVLVWLYAAIRPRFGPGPKTAAMAGVALWFVAYVVPTVWFGAMGLALGTGATVLTLIWGLIELPLAGVAGGWLYQEEEPEAEAAATQSTGPATPPPTM